MKLVKLTMLAATAALAASALIGSSSASAVTHPWIALCDAQQLLLCATSHLLKHPLLGRFLLSAGAGKFNAGFVTVECTFGFGETNLVESQQKQNPVSTSFLPTEAFKATLESLSFGPCKSCTNFEVTTPQSTGLWMEGSEGTWWLTAENTRIKLLGCPLGASCTYEGNLKLKVQMNSEGAFSDPEGKEFKFVGGTFGCAEKGKWETGRTRFEWKLDDNGLAHREIWPTLLENLTLASGVEL